MKSANIQEIKLFFWNPQTRKCLGRTGESWLKLIAFYIALYTCLAAIWTIYFYIFHLTISTKYPKWQLDESIIGTNPGVGLRPQSPHQKVESALISYRKGLDGDYQHWVEDLKQFLEYPNKNSNTHYDNDNNNSKQSTFKQDCSSNKDASDIDSYCPFDNSSIPPECTAAQNFSFPIGKPCILIKLNRVSNMVSKKFN